MQPVRFAALVAASSRVDIPLIPDKLVTDDAVNMAPRSAPIDPPALVTTNQTMSKSMAYNAIDRSV